MSCGNPTTESDALMPRRLKYDKSRTCVKCKENQGNLVIRHAVYCKTCFFPLISYKFRRALEPYVNPKPDGPRRTALKPSGDLLVGYSGGLGSSVLLDLVHRSYVSPKTSANEGGRDHPRNERVWKNIYVCNVDVSDAFPDMKSKAEEIRNAVEEHTGLEYIQLHLYDAFDPAWWRQIGGDPPKFPLGVDLTREDLPLASGSTESTPVESLRSYLASLPTPTAVTTAVHTLTRLLLHYTAWSHNCSHLLLGASLTSLAVSLISGICQGGGFHVKEEMQEEWSPYKIHDQQTKVDVKRKRTVRIIRPLRDVGMKECAAWAWWMGVKVVGREKLEWVGSKQGIGRLTKDFIVGLEKDYPSTVSTIVRTCGKLAPKGEVDGACLLCERPVQHGVQEWKARISIRSRQTDDEQTQPSSTSVPPSLTHYLCYACHTTLTSRTPRPMVTPFPSNGPPTSVPMPVWTLTNVRDLHLSDSLEDETGEEAVGNVRKMSESEMKDAVKDFLLDDS
ncbi:hypothetical protein K474DRAFT_1593380 [Panus rudis PR-1116 ss-1]|nr:hypothetical protein K474DRAFT_1593380 [Panus rudis PR-1116 ss-1]